MDRKIIFQIREPVASISLFLKEQKIPKHTRAGLKLATGERLSFESPCPQEFLQIISLETGVSLSQ